jgi:hypothetical protein
MSFEITEAFVKQYNSTIYHLVQQKGSRLKDKTRNESQKGDEQFFDRLGSVVAAKKTGRHSDTPLISTPHSRRRVTLEDYEHADLIDDQDLIRTLIDPTSAYSEAFMWSFGRAMDDEIILAADGSAYSGQNGQTVVAHPNSQKIASVDSGAGSGLNVQALRRAKKAFDAADVDESITRHSAINSDSLESLLSELEVTSSDYNSVKALVMGEVDTFLGFKFIRTERLGAQSGALAFDVAAGTVGAGAGDADGYRKNIFWAQDGLLFSQGMGMETRIDERSDKSYSTQVFARMSVGATRMEEEKVVIVLSNEA